MDRAEKLKNGKVPEQKTNKNFEPPGCSKNVKRQRAEYFMPRPECVEELTKSSGKDDCPVENALFNVLILQQIFSNIRTSFLLSTCSLVNKAWNAEARKYVRDHRSCIAKNDSETTACEFMEKLDHICEQMKQSGRVVPFNYLKLSFYKICEKQLDGDQILYSTIISELKLKGLKLSGRHDCQHHKPLLALLQNKNRELQSLQISSTDPFYRFSQDWFPQLPQLQEFSLESFWRWNVSQVGRERIGWLLQGAPNLNRICLGRQYCLELVPEEVLTRVAIHGTLELRWQDVNFLCAIAGKVCGLKQLSFYVEPPNPLEDPDFLEGQGDGAYGDSEQESDEEEESQSIEDNLADAKRQQQYNSGLELLLQTAQQSLKRIKTNCGYPLSGLSHPPLINLSKLAMTLRDENEKDWHDLTSINFESSMPRLQEVNLIIEVEIPRGNVLYSSGTVRELNVELKTEEFNLRLLGQLFPKVSILNLLLKDCWLRFAGPRVKWRRAPISVVCENWPGLEELKISGPPGCVSHNYDADLCGISWDEGSRLRREDDEYLKKVQIVPGKPSLLTLPKLRDFWFVEDLFLHSHNDEPAIEDPQEIVSKVTKFLVFNRVPQMNVCLPYLPKVKATTITTRTVKLGWHYW